MFYVLMTPVVHTAGLCFPPSPSPDIMFDISTMVQPFLTFRYALESSFLGGSFDILIAFYGAF
jgi:hypothetical protein